MSADIYNSTFKVIILSNRSDAFQVVFEKISDGSEWIFEALLRERV
jgi:hypothetical protein